MIDSVKDRHEEKVKISEIDLENAKITAAEAEAYTEMVTKDDFNKEIDQENMKIELTRLK